MAKGESGFSKTGKSNSDNEQALTERIKKLEQKIKTLQDESIQVLKSRENSFDPTPQRYYEIAREVRGLKDERLELDKKRAEIIRNKRSQRETKTFVNSFGEATKREITSASYERAQRRLDKQIWSRFKGR